MGREEQQKNSILPEKTNNIHPEAKVSGDEFRLVADGTQGAVFYVDFMEQFGRNRGIKNENKRREFHVLVSGSDL
jgi:hypothetical protein